MKLRWLAWTTSAIGLTLLNDCGGFGMDCSFGVGWSPKVCKFALHQSSSTQEHQEIRTENDMNVKTSDVLSLDSIRSTLIRQEETIIFALIERAAFRSNCIVYEKSNQANSFGRLGIPDGAVVTQENKGELEQLTFMEYMLLSTVSFLLSELCMMHPFAAGVINVGLIFEQCLSNWTIKCLIVFLIGNPPQQS